ncbi:NADPH2:quinone reductase [Paraburkholderia sp. GAS199]|uniref:alcohol dehydrogenase catalytic domain-containing protein n=1 Tax=Paraburkholderia sp. GAS199 TaxID=3035126 RepID=UPI003D247116
MRAIVCEAVSNALDGVHMRERTVPQPGRKEVRVTIHAASLNPVDWKLACGVAPWMTPPRILGLDGAGVVDAVGEDADHWRVGDRVAWHGNLARDGVFAEYAVAPEHVLARIPDSVDFGAAAALPCAAMTAFQALVRKARVTVGETVLIQGAGGAVGGFAVQIAKSLGARVIALARPALFDRVRTLGADFVFDRHDRALRERIHELTDHYGVDVMLEVANPGDARKSLDLIRYNGQLLCIDPMPNLADVPPYTYAASIHEVALGGAYACGHLPTQRDFPQMLQTLLSMVEQGRLDPMIDRAIALNEVPQALRDLREGASAGKIVVDVAR